MIIYSETRGEVTVLRIQGIVKFGESSVQFSTYLDKVLQETTGPVLLDFEKIDLLDSSGLGELVGYVQRFQLRHRKIAIVRPRERVETLLRLTRLDNVLPIFPDEAAALAYALAGPEPVPGSREPVAGGR